MMREAMPEGKRDGGPGNNLRVGRISQRPPYYLTSSTLLPPNIIHSVTTSQHLLKIKLMTPEILSGTHQQQKNHEHSQSGFKNPNF